MQPKFPPGTRFKAIAASDNSLAVSTKGRVYSWGSNGGNQSVVPDGLSNVVAVAGGDLFTLALKADGTIAAWGDNDYGETNVPPEATNVIAIASGGDDCLALKVDGSVVAWGSLNTVPDGLTNVTAISCGIFHDAALKSDGTVVTWGGSPYGDITVPPGLTNVVAISAAWDHTMALKNDGTVVYWGNLNKTTQSNFTAIAAGNSDLLLTSNGDVVLWTDSGLSPIGSNAVAVASSTGSDNFLFLRADGTIGDGGDNADGQSIPPGSLTNVTSAAAGEDFTVALKKDGALLSWGLEPDVAAQLATETNIIALAASTYYFLGLRQNHTVVAWRDDTYTPPAGLTNVIAITAGHYHAMALLRNGTVVTWGANDVPPPLGLNNVTAIAAGDDFSLALKNDGTVTAWGDDSLGQCDVPPGLTNVIAIAANEQVSAAVRGDGTVVAWGNISDESVNVPAGLTNVISIAGECNSSHFVALLRDGSVTGWGRNDWGEASFPPTFGNATMIAVGDDHSVAVVRDTPALDLCRISQNASFQADFFGDPGCDYTFQTSTNLANWDDESTLTCTNCRMPFVDTTAGFSKRFYRVKVNQD